GKKHRLRHAPIRPGRSCIGDLRRFSTRLAMGKLGGESSSLVCDRPKRKHRVCFETELCNSDGLSRRCRFGNKGAGKGGEVADGCGLPLRLSLATSRSPLP